MRIGVSLGYWQDRPPEEALDTARLADDLGFDELWLGEMATYDVFALATAVGLATRTIPLTVGPLAVAVRDPVGMAMGAASVASLVGRPVHLAIGTSSPVVVERWHGRSAGGGARRLEATALAVGPLLRGERSSGYRLRLPPPGSSVTIAAFGPRAVRVAAAHGDRMVINLCTAPQAARLAAALADACSESGRTRPPLAAWIPAAVDPAPEAVEQLRRALVSYVAAPGYGEMFADAGFGEVVAAARAGASPSEVLEGIPAGMVEAIGLVGDAASCRARMEEYAAAGVSEVALVPATAGDPAGRRTLSALAPSGRGT